MKLRIKILITFFIVLGMTIPGIFFGLTAVLDEVSTGLMKRQAENSALFLSHGIDFLTEHEGFFSSATSSKLLTLAKHVSDESQGYDVSKILLIGKDFKVLASYPSDEIGSDYSTHADIRNAFLEKKMVTVLETNLDSNGDKSTDIDVVNWLEITPGVPAILEMKLDFAKSISLLELQYSDIERIGVGLSIGLFLFLFILLLILLTKTAIKPVVLLTSAMDAVGKGNMDVSMPVRGHDEFSILATRFNEMVVGIKEKIKLTQYVSKSTANAVKDSISGNGDHPSQKKVLTLFFSDIRGFTSYSEKRDPKAVISTLNKVLSLQARIIRNHGGDIDKFVGDEVMAVFSSSEQAVLAALEIQKDMTSQLQELEGLSIGIGIHTGEVVQGDVGSDDIRDYTVIGDSVNTAARLESVAEKGQVLISEEVLFEIKELRAWIISPKGELSLKGKSNTVKTFLITG